MAFAIGIEMSINVDMGIDPSRHDGQSFQIVSRALGVWVDPVHFSNFRVYPMIGRQNAIQSAVNCGRSAKLCFAEGQFCTSQTFEHWSSAK